jgi:hypothetical protein
MLAGVFFVSAVPTFVFCASTIATKFIRGAVFGNTPEPLAQVATSYHDEIANPVGRPARENSSGFHQVQPCRGVDFSDPGCHSRSMFGVVFKQFPCEGFRDGVWHVLFFYDLYYLLLGQRVPDVENLYF